MEELVSFELSNKNAVTVPKVAGLNPSRGQVEFFSTYPVRVRSLGVALTYILHSCHVFNFEKIL